MTIVDYSLLTNHLHLVVECSDSGQFVRGMRALCIRLGLQGTIFAMRRVA